LGFLSEHEEIVPHGVLKVTVVRNRGSHMLLTMWHTLLSYFSRIKTCLKSCERWNWVLTLTMRILSLLDDLGKNTISWLWSTESTLCGLKHARFGPIPKTFSTNFWQCHGWRFPPFVSMELASSVRAPHLLLIAHSMILSVNLLLPIHKTKIRDLRGWSEFAKSTFGGFSAVPTCLADSDLIRCVTSVSSMLIGLMSTSCRCGKSWTGFSLTRCVTIW
jgi:hypothetical protein